MLGVPAGDHEPTRSNDPVDVAGLPLLEVSEFQPLHPAYRRIRTLGSAAVGLAATAIAGAIIVTGPPTAVAIIAALVWLVVIGGCIVHRLEVDHMGYLVRELDLSFRSGLLTRSVSTAPFARVQHVGIGHGPIDRRYGLATLQVRTAGGGITVPGIDAELAEQLKQLVTERAAALADHELDDPDELADPELADPADDHPTAAPDRIESGTRPLPPPDVMRGATTDDDH